MKKVLCLLVSYAVLTFYLSSGLTQSLNHCEALPNTDFSQILDAPTKIISTKLVDESKDLPEYCQVKAYVSPNVGIDLWLPTTDWNGKFLEVACGGRCGYFGTETGACDDPLRRGYACLASDMGHTSTGGDVIWAYNNMQAEIDYGFRGIHVSALSGKAIVNSFYSQTPDHSYLIGCSGGGRLGLMSAQRFPWDFDGIISGAPAISMSSLNIRYAWTLLVSRDENGQAILTKSDLELVNRAVLSQCDLDDGVKDGILSNPRHCAFEPSDIACNRAETSACLNPEKVEVVEKIYAGPTTSDGAKLYRGAPLKGSELSSGASWTYGNKTSALEKRVLENFRYIFLLPDPGTNWDLSNFDLFREYKRLGLMQSIFDSDNPDLRKFKSTGGKLILYHGMNDVGIPPVVSIDYYETVEKTMGGRDKTQDFFRLFMMPGMDHCGGGPGADTVDYLHYLEAWVEKDEAPDKILSTKRAVDMYYGLTSIKFPLNKKDIKFTRPVYPYPKTTKYKGDGDPNDWSSYTEVDPQ